MKLLLACLTAFAIATHDLDEKALHTIHSGALQIAKATDPSEILVFIGNSASYFYHALKEVREHSYLVPVSGLSYRESPLDLIDQTKVGKFDSVFLEPIRQEASRSEKKVVLIDYTLTGKSMDVFKALLGIEDAEGLHLVMMSQFPYQAANPKDLYIRKMIFLGNVGWSLVNDDAYIRFTPTFDVTLWETSSPALLTEFQSEPRRAQNIARIKPIKPEDLLGSEVDGVTRMLRLADIEKTWHRIPRQHPCSWQEHLEVDLGHFIKYVKMSLERSPIQFPMPQRFMQIVLEAKPVNYEADLSSKELVLESIILAATDIFYSPFPLANVLVNRRLPKIIAQDDEMAGLLGESFIRAVLGIPVESEEQLRAFHAAIGLDLVCHARPELCRKIMTEQHRLITV